jgi:hypothetical protein
MRDAPSSTSPRRPADALDEAMKLPPQQGDQQRTYSFDEAMKLPPQEPEPDSALGALKGAKHPAGPALDLQRSRLVRRGRLARVAQCPLTDSNTCL